LSESIASSLPETSDEVLGGHDDLLRLRGSSGSRLTLSTVASLLDGIPSTKPQSNAVFDKLLFEGVPHIPWHRE
jgi:hypothetical protein